MSAPKCESGFQYMNNAQHADPCAVAFDVLHIACVPKQAYPLSPLADGITYSPPFKAEADPCLCNLPMYSLISACAFCQGQQILSFATWTANCPPGTTSNTTTLPNTTVLPLDLPQFAFFPLNSSDFFDVNEAKSNTQTVPSMLPASTQSASSSDKSSHTENNLQILITVVVVVTLFLITILLIALLVYRKRHSKGSKGYFRLSYGRNSLVSNDSATSSPSRSTTAPPGWLSKISLPRFLRTSMTGRISPYQPDHPVHRQTQNNNTSIRKPQMPSASASTPSLNPIPPNASTSLYQAPNNNLSQQSLRSTTAPARPGARRIETLPVMQSIVRPTHPHRSASGDGGGFTTPAPGSTHEPTARRPDRIMTIPRPAGFKIEDTPVATEQRTPWREAETLPAHNAAFGVPTSSLAVFAESEDSDSLRSPPYESLYDGGGLLLGGEKHTLTTTPPLSGRFPMSPPLSVRQLPVSPPVAARHLPTTPPASARHPPTTPPASAGQYPNTPPGNMRQPSTPPSSASQYPSPPPLSARQLPLTSDIRKMPSNQSLRSQSSLVNIGPSHGRQGSRTFPKPPMRKESFASIAFTNFDTDTTESLYGSSQPPMSAAPLSPAIQSSQVHSHRLPEDDHIIYGGPDSRQRLFPVAVRAAGYTGIPPSEQG